MDFFDWSPRDYALFGTALGATAYDVDSTARLERRGGTETDPLVPGGKKPSDPQLAGSALVASGLATALAAALPEKYRGAFLGGWTGLEGGLAARNDTLTRKSPRNFGADLTAAALPAAAGAALGYFLPSGSGDSAKVTPYFRPAGKSQEAGVVMTKSFGAGGPVMAVNRYRAPVFRIHGFPRLIARRRRKVTMKLLRTR